MENQAVASLKHFLRRFCPPLLLTASNSNGFSGSSSKHFHLNTYSDSNEDAEYKTNFDDDEDEDSEAEKATLLLLKKCLKSPDSNDILLKFATTGDYPVLLVELFEYEGIHIDAICNVYYYS